MHPEIEKALEFLGQANFAGYFSSIESVVPDGLKNDYHHFKQEFEIEGVKVFFAQRLETFAKSVQEVLVGGEAVERGAVVKTREELEKEEALKDVVFNFNFFEQEQYVQEVLRNHANFAILGLNNNTEDEAKFLFRLLESRWRNSLEEKEIESVFYTLSPKIASEDEILDFVDNYLPKKRKAIFLCIKIENKVDKAFLKKIVEQILKEYKTERQKPCLVFFLIKPKFVEDIQIVPHSSEKVAQTKTEETLQEWREITKKSFLTWASTIPEQYTKQNRPPDDIFTDYIGEIDCIDNYIENQKKYVYYLLEEYMKEIGYELQIDDNLELQLSPCNPK
jgi:hypothetical protein